MPLEMILLKRGRALTRDDSRIEGEEQLIAEFFAPLTVGHPAALGLTDDCALITPRPDEDLVLKTDPIVEGIHFRPGDDPADIAWKALAVNVSDLAAKGACPLVYLMALSLPEAPRRAWMARFAAGLAEAQEAFGIVLAGGDTDRVPGRLSVAITVIGTVPHGAMVRRAGAEAGHALYVTGTLGDSALGLAVLHDPGLAGRLGLTTTEVAHVTRRYHRPEPRTGLRRALLSHATAAMDLSDGLAKDLGRMCRASGVGARVEIATLPLSVAVRRAVTRDYSSAMTRVVSGGDDYEILAAVDPAQKAGFEALASAGGVRVTHVGAVTKNREVHFLDVDGRPLELARTGWDHFQPPTQK